MKLALLTALVLSGVLAPAIPRSSVAQEIAPTTPLTASTIDDPSFGRMKAFTVTLPSGWQFQGTVIPSLHCSLPSPVFRAYSSDGLTEMRLMPSFNWQVKTGSKADWEGLGVPPECIYLKETFTAAQFLDRYVRTLYGAHVVGPMSVAVDDRQQLDKLLSQMNANYSQGVGRDSTATGDIAALRLEAVNGTFTIEQRLRARVICTLRTKPVANFIGNCSARVDVLRAPKGRLDALAAFVDSHNLTNAKHDDSWLYAVLARMGAHGEKLPFDPPHPDRAALAMVHRQAEDFGWIAERRYERGHEFENIRDVPERRYERLMKMLKPPDVTPDWADFALDSLPQIGSGGALQPSTVHAWSSSTGQRYGTCNPNANPNGVLAGSWTENTQVHGNDQPQ